MDTEESEDEMFPITYESPRDKGAFVYNDPLLVSGVLRAVVEADLEKIIQLVADGKSLNINDNNGNTPLHVAVINNNLDILEYLVKQDDIRINTRNFMGQTPLYLAVKCGCVEASKILINNGANVNLSDYEDVTPLHRSVQIPELAHLLIKNGANVNVVDYSDDTPLHDAVADKCLETVCMLLYYGADANAIGGNGLTPFMKALISEHSEIQDTLFDYVDDYNATTLDEYSTLSLALTNENCYVERIIDRGADVDVAAFTACVSIPNADNFKLIWSNLSPDYVEDPDVNLMLLFYELDAEDFERYIDVIIKYSQSSVLEILAAKTRSSYYASLIEKCTKDDFLSHDQITQLTCLLLQHGLQIGTDVIVAVYVNMGYCELFKILMFMDYTDIWSSFVITPRLIFDVHTDIMTRCKELIAKEFAWTNARRLKEDLMHSFGYWIYRPLIEVILRRFADDGMSETADKELQDYYNEFKGYYDTLPKVPSLLELARNMTRKYIVDRMQVQSTSQYYTYVNSLDLSVVYKKVLFFERKIYDYKF